MTKAKTKTQSAKPKSAAKPKARPIRVGDTRKISRDSVVASFPNCDAESYDGTVIDIAKGVTFISVYLPEYGTTTIIQA